MTKLICSTCLKVYKTRQWKPAMDEARCGCGGSRVAPSQLRRLHPAPVDEGDVRASRLDRPVADPSGGGASNAGRRRRKSLKRGRGLSASREQQVKVRDLPCVVCGRDRFEVTITAMHVYPRRFAACSCADGVVPGCIECHPKYEAKQIDLLGLLIAHDFRRELVHAVVEHHAPIFHVLEIVTGSIWVPKSEPAPETTERTAA